MYDEVVTSQQWHIYGIKVLEVDNRCWKMWDLDLNLPPACFSLACLVPPHTLIWAWLKSYIPSSLLLSRMKGHLDIKPMGLDVFLWFLLRTQSSVLDHSWIRDIHPLEMLCHAGVIFALGGSWACASGHCSAFSREGCSSILTLLLQQMPQCQQLLCLQINAGSPFIFTNQV